VSFGKIPVNKFINKLPIGDCEICPSIGEDAGVIEVNEKYLIIHSDPITETREDAGFLSVAVACNDINMKGVKCKWVINTILLSHVTHLEKIITGISEACNIIGCKILGGHTEVTDGISKDIVVTTALSTNNSFLSYNNVKEGMKVILVGNPGIEGTWILAKDYEDLLTLKGVDKKIIENAKKFRNDIIIQDKALKIKDYVAVMHDATEGGILQALLEIAKASNHKVVVDLEKIKLRDETRVISSALNIDPFKLISSGAFIAISDKPDLIINSVSDAYIIGEVLKGDPILHVKGVGDFNEDFEEELVEFESRYNGWRKG